MKQKLWMAALMLAALPAGAQQVKYTVNGVSNNNGATIKLVNRQTNQEVGSTVVADGKFSFSGSAEKDALMAVGDMDANWATLFFNDGTPVTVNINDSTLKGSPINERLVRYDVELGGPQGIFMKKIQAMSDEEKQNKIQELTAEMRTIMTNMSQTVSKIFQDESQTIIPAAFFSEYLQFYGMEKFDSLLKLKPVWASHPFVQDKLKAAAQQRAMEEKKNAFIGQQFTDLEEADVDGNMHKLSEYAGKGRWLLVDFWASWCGPCRQEMPNVVAAYEKYHAKGFDIIGLSFDNKKEPWVKAIADLKMPWAHLSDLKGWNTVASGVYGVNSIPDNLLIDPQGKIVARGLRAEGLHAKLKEIFGE